MAAQNITFPGTSNNFLASTTLDPWIVGPQFQSIDELLRNSPVFKEIYDYAILPEELWGDFYAGTYQGTAEVPNVHSILGSDFDPSMPTYATQTGIVGSVLTAYNTHQNLQLRPDDIWISILAQFSAYVNGRADELRSKIVNFEGKKPLTVSSSGTIDNINFGALTQALLEEIGKNVIDETLVDWFRPGFTTTTETDDVCGAAMAMCGLKEFFTYRVNLICGIPQVTLLGTVEDWQRLRYKIDKLEDFDGADEIITTMWLPLLREIADNFVESAKNGSENNLSFWNHIVSSTDATCDTEINGWLSTFSIFNREGQLYTDMSAVEAGTGWPVLKLSDIYHNIAFCPTTIDDNGITYDGTLFVGQMAYGWQVDEEATANQPDAVSVIATDDGMMRKIIPRNDWALVISDGLVNKTALPMELIQDMNPPTYPFWSDINTPQQCILGDYEFIGDGFYDPWVPPTSDTPVAVDDSPTTPTDDTDASGGGTNQETSASASMDEGADDVDQGLIGQLAGNSNTSSKNDNDGVPLAAWLVPAIVVVLIGLVAYPLWKGHHKTGTESRAAAAAVQQHGDDDDEEQHDVFDVNEDPRPPTKKESAAPTENLDVSENTCGDFLGSSFVIGDGMPSAEA